MFDLEQSIAEWRKQMLAAGIKAPVPLEELESHLREEVEERIKLGLSEQQAFEATVLQIGQGQELQTEFAKERSWRDLLGGNISKTQKKVLNVWVIFCVLEPMIVYDKHNHSATTLLTHVLLIISLAIIGIAAYLTGIFWSVFLINTSKRARSIIRVIVNVSNFLLFIPFILDLTRPHHFDALVHILFIPIYFNVFTSILLQSPSPAEPKKAAN
jgi:hypothetical protein